MAEIAFLESGDVRSMFLGCVLLLVRKCFYLSCMIPFRFSCRKQKSYFYGTILDRHQDQKTYPIKKLKG